MTNWPDIFITLNGSFSWPNGDLTMLFFIPFSDILAVAASIESGRLMNNKIGHIDPNAFRYIERHIAPSMRQI